MNKILLIASCLLISSYAIANDVYCPSNVTSDGAGNYQFTPSNNQNWVPETPLPSGNYSFFSARAEMDGEIPTCVLQNATNDNFNFSSKTSLLYPITTNQNWEYDAGTEQYICEGDSQICPLTTVPTSSN